MASEQTLTPTRRTGRTAFGILGAISLAHLLNDMLQSLLLAIYPLLQRFQPQLCANWFDYADVSGYGLIITTADWLLHRQISETPVTAGRDGVYPVRSGAADLCQHLSAGAAGRGAGWLRLLGVPSGIVARSAHGIRRPPRAGSVAVSGRW